MPRSGPHDGAATRRALLDAASKLFATEGVAKVSVRAINAEAKLGAASTHYHFGSKDAILEAVLLDAGAGVLARIHDLAEQAVESDRTLDGRELVDLLAVPYREFLSSDPVKASRWLSICGQLSLSNDPRLFPVEDNTTKLLYQLLERAYPEVGGDDISAKWSLAVNTLIVMAARWADANISSEVPVDDGISDALVDFVAGGLDALMRRPGRGSAAS
ncbi:TetR/AcrR family transcriptional regulator [Nocardia sp. CA2R105]|uniref:TetR/AcrR family transcriptional regulator n=1 Tax=Nocardia coffeae TaxID=2873381 RepID=UPI001CA76DAF|nr:TetR/AcrR family transcriptional regulator [Nocardia coffeae]MBY8856840.1 TetR/AcrR family transcriptional regulator [Nocardia coffeae]